MTAEIGTVTVTHHDGNGTWVIALAGEHDISTTPLIEQQTNSLWPGCSAAVVDLSDATFIDGSVVTWLLRTRRHFETNGHPVLVIVEGSAGPGPMRVLEITGIRTLVPCYPTRQDALDAAATDQHAGHSPRARPQADHAPTGRAQRRPPEQPNRPPASRPTWLSPASTRSDRDRHPSTNRSHEPSALWPSPPSHLSATKQ
jgi:anti-anti-sigma factor